MAEALTKAFTPYQPKPDEEYMNKNQLKHFRGILNGWKSELSHDIDRTVHTMQDEVTMFADPNDRASQESDMTLELRNRDRERKLIKKIEETLRNIDADEYGYCEGCGIEIGLKRLEARPKQRKHCRRSPQVLGRALRNANLGMRRRGNFIATSGCRRRGTECCPCGW